MMHGLAFAFLTALHASTDPLPTLHWWDKGEGHATPMGYFFINFALLLWGLWRFALPMLRNHCQQRATLVQQTMATNQQAYVETASRLAALEQALQQEPEQQSSRRAESEKIWQQQAQEALSKGQSFAERLQLDAQQRLQEEQRQQRRALVRQLGLQAIANVQHRLPQRLQAKEQQQLVQESIEQVALGPSRKV